MTASIGFHIKLHPERDADLLAALDAAGDKSARFRELARLGLSVERRTIPNSVVVLRSTVAIEPSMSEEEMPTSPGNADDDELSYEPTEE